MGSQRGTARCKSRGETGWIIRSSGFGVFVFFKVQFFGGDRTRDLGRIKTKEILHFPGKKRLYSLTLHSLSLCETALQLFLLSSFMQTLPFVRWLQLRFALAYATYWRSLSDRGSCLEPSIHLEKFCQPLSSRPRLRRGFQRMFAKSQFLLIGTLLYMV